MEENKQHVQLPNDMTNVVRPKDLLVYISIKRFMNNETKIAFPSISTISKLSGACPNTVQTCIKNLENFGYIEVKRSKVKGQPNEYKFNSTKTFEPFSYEFLDNENLSFTEKAYLLASQQYMFKENEVGKISMTNKELSQVINMPESTISKCNRDLIKKDYLNELQIQSALTGKTKKEKIFKLMEFGQAVVFTLKNHEDRLNNTESEISELKEQIKSLQKDLNIALKNLNQKESIPTYTM